MKKLFFALIITALSCQNDSYMKEYYDNGKLKMKYETSNGLKHGKMIEYYPSGNILSLSNWENDTINGYSIGYYESGNIEFISYWFDGKLYGDYTIEQIPITK
jgi:antitoxin component YwqK of YwqJK toxin-antitoxin module